MPRQRQRSTQARVGINFIIADPSSSRERPNNLRIVRSHVGRWRWQQAKQNLEGESQQASGADNVPSAKHSHDDGSFEPDFTEILADDLVTDFGADIDVFPFLASESVVSDEGSNYWRNPQDHNFFASSDQEWMARLSQIFGLSKMQRLISTSAHLCVWGVSPRTY